MRAPLVLYAVRRTVYDVCSSTCSSCINYRRIPLYTLVGEFGSMRIRVVLHVRVHVREYVRVLVRAPVFLLTSSR